MLPKSVSLTASLVVLCAMAAPQVAQATVASASGASAACKAASGPGASVFYFDTTGALNTSASTQYLTCNIPDVDGQGGIGTDIQELHLLYSNTSGVDVHITCVLQGITWGVASNTVYDLYAGAGTDNNPAFLYKQTIGLMMPLRGDNGFYTMSCAIPAGASLNMIKAYYPGTIGA